ncbi:MAG TPA: four helix bundle protein [Pyrinomonadaceae bacterium]|jgi:four helix bundle protein
MQRVPAQTFRDLIWQKAHGFVLAAYALSKSFPRDEMYGLTSQFRRAAISIAANIVEGFKKKGQHDKARILNIAQASLEECRYYLILIADLKYADTGKLNEQLEEVSRLLTAYTSVVVSDF